MTPLPPVPGVLSAVLAWTVGADAGALTKLHLGYTGGVPSANDCSVFATAINTQVANHLASLASAATILDTVTVTDLGSSTGAQAVNGTNVTGTRSGSGITAGTAVLTNYQVARRYRGGKPRSYFPFFVVSDIDGPSIWSPGSVSEATTKIQAFFAGVIGTVSSAVTIAQHVSVSYFNGFTNVPYGQPVKYRRVPTQRATPIVDQVISLSVNAKPGSQRRRLLHSR